ncbi:hypothetical protein OS493_020931 [Desmophyllum pertusum]|uniref:Uncharacterized protein n=1 Tax=Desmophyllum pertusum TaxID=174260 RepID=A0A9X0D8Y2_9CNID|nr:hypothetical protein OS493_020931 [Desmophyllum pertusum]
MEAGTKQLLTNAWIGRGGYFSKTFSIRMTFHKACPINDIVNVIREGLQLMRAGRTQPDSDNLDVQRRPRNQPIEQGE